MFLLRGDCKRILELANEAAQTCGARLSLVHVLAGLKGATDQIHEEAEAQYITGEIQKSVGCDAQLRIVRGSRHEALLNAVRQTTADLLIIGRDASSDHEAVTSFRYGIVWDSPVPVLSL